MSLRTLIGALLGPDRPELGCDACFALLDEYVDHAVSDSAALADHYPQMHAHLDGCPVCREEFESLYALVTEEETA